MTTLLAKQVAAFKQHHGITAVGTKRQVAPSILFSPQEAKSHDPETFAALALHGLSEAAVLEPKLSQYSELFEGTMKDRDLLTKEENGAIDQKIHKLLLLLSPHLQARAAQECVEGLLYRYHAHRWNVDDLMAAALPHHDSPLFTKLVQGLHVENRPRWAWLSTLKAKPATLIRSRLAKYCSKDTAVLSFLGDILEETLQMQLENRALMTFFAAIWLDTIALSVGNDLVQVAIQSLLKLLSQPAQQDAFYAGVTVTGALCAKIQLEESVQGQLLVRLAKQAVGEDGRAAFEVMAAMSQLQELEKMPGGVVKVLAKHGPEELLRAASPSVDAGNLLAMVVKAGLGVEEENAQALVQGLLEDSSLMKHHAPQLCRAVLQAFLEGLRNAATAKARKKTVARFQAPAKCLGCAPLELNEAMRQTLSKVDKDTAETLVQLAPTCDGGDGDGSAAQASRKSAKVRGKAIAKTSVAAVVLATPEEIEGEERQRLLASLANVEASPRRRNRNGTGENREVVQRLMRLVLRKPKELAADLQTALNQESSRAALLALALGPHEKGVVSANALRMLKSLVSKKGWPLDQHMLPLIMVKIANAQELEVRSAAVAFLKLLKDSTVEKAAEATLVEAGLLKAKSAVLPDKAWSLVTAHLGNDLWSSLMELLLKNEKEMLQDRAATATALMKLWAPKGLKSQRQEALSFMMVSLARCEGAEKLMEALPLSALQCVKEPLCKAVAELSKKGASQAFSLLAAALKLMTQGKEKGDKGKAQETLVDVARSVVFPLCLALAKRCEAEVAWDATLVDLACDSCWVVSRLAAAHSELLEEATNSLFRFTVSLRGLVKISEDQSKMAKVVAAASTALAEVPTDVNTLMVSMLKCDVMQGKRLKEPQGVAAAQLISEQVLSLPSLPGRSKLLMALATAAKEAGKHLPKDADSGGAVVHLLLAVAAVSEQLAQDESSEEAAEAASSVPAVCQAVDEASSVCLDICFSSLIRCCGSLSVLAAEGSCALQLLQKAIRKVHLRPEALVLLKGNMRRLWRYPEADDWRIPQARLRGLLHSIFQAVEVSKTTSLAWASSSGTRASLDFTILLMLVRRARQEQPVMPKKKRRKKRSDPINEEVDEALEALTAPSSEELLLDEVFEMLTAVEPSERYHAFGIFLMDLAAWCSKMKSSELPWGALVPDEVIAELDEDMSFRVLGQGVQLASRFLLEHGLPDELDTEEVDTSVLLEMMEEKEGSIALALSHGLRSLCIIEALLTQTPGQSREEVQCRKQTQDLQGLLMRSLSVNHPATFFRALCLSLGVKGKAPKGNASTLLAEQEFVSHLSSRVMRAAAKALKDRRDIRDDDEEAEEGSATSREAIIQHVCKRFLSGDHAEMGTSWEFLDEICRFSQSSSMLSSALPKAGTFLASLATSPDEAATRAAVKCCQCVETMVFTLGHGILPKLNDITQPLLDLAQRVVQSSQSSESALDLDGQILQALGALCRSVGGVLSPFLGQFLQVVCAPASLLRTKSLEELASQLVDGVPHRLLLKEVQKATVDPFKDSEMDLEEAMIRSQRLSTFYLWILVKATPEFAASHDIMPSLLRLFGCSGSAVRAFLSTADAQEIPLRLLKREPSMELITSSHMQDLSWSNVAQDASLQRLQMLGGACFARFCLFLEPDDVKTRIAKVLDWARGKQDKLLARPKNEVRDEDASKTLALMAALTTLAVEAEGLAEELLMPLANKDISSALKASHSVALRLAREKLPRKKRRTLSGSRTDKEVLSSQSWWWYDVAMACLNFLGLAFKQGSNSGPEAKVWAESFEELLEPCVSILDVFEFLAVDDAICSGLARVLQSALVAMTASSAEDGVKRMMQAVLEKTRSEDAEVVLMALRCAHRIWSDLGIQVVMSLSEVVMYTSELQDHEDSRVETEVKAMVRTIEDCTGESLHDAMKT